MNWMEIQTLSLCFIVSTVKECDFVWLGRDWLWESVSDPFVKHSFKNVVIGKVTKLVQYVFCAVFDIWEDGCGFVQWVWKRDFWTTYLFGWRERIYWQVLIDLCVVYVLFGHEVFREISRCLSVSWLYVAWCVRVVVVLLFAGFTSHPGKLWVEFCLIPFHLSFMSCDLLLWLY